MFYKFIDVQMHIIYIFYLNLMLLAMWSFLMQFADFNRF
jgi:hypothetical protein